MPKISEFAGFGSSETTPGFTTDCLLVLEGRLCLFRRHRVPGSEDTRDSVASVNWSGGGGYSVFLYCRGFLAVCKGCCMHLGIS